MWLVRDDDAVSDSRGETGGYCEMAMVSKTCWVNERDMQLLCQTVRF